MKSMKQLGLTLSIFGVLALGLVSLPSVENANAQGGFGIRCEIHRENVSEAFREDLLRPENKG